MKTMLLGLMLLPLNLGAEPRLNGFDLRGEPVVVTFCPLCGTGLVFSWRLDGRTLRFGVSGLLYNSDMLMYDLQSESLWSQIPGKVVSGEFAGKQLERVSVVHMRWEAWRERCPDSLVLSDQTGYRRDYGHNPYCGYENNERLYFPVERDAGLRVRLAHVLPLYRGSRWLTLTTRNKKTMDQSRIANALLGLRLADAGRVCSALYAA